MTIDNINGFRWLFSFVFYDTILLDYILSTLATNVVVPCLNKKTYNIIIQWAILSS